MFSKNPNWILKRAKRGIPHPEILLRIITEFFDTSYRKHCVFKVKKQGV